MWMHQIFAAIILYLKSGLAMEPENVEDLDFTTFMDIPSSSGSVFSEETLFKKKPTLYFLHAFDWNYDYAINLFDFESIVPSDHRDTPSIMTQVQTCSDRYDWTSIWENQRNLHCIYTSIITAPENKTAERIFLNFLLTVQAYEFAVHFHVCIVYHKNVTPKRDDIIKNCERVFHFMELFFNLMHKETVNDFCEIGNYVQKEEASLTAEDICEILKTLNLDYIKNEYYRKPSDVKDGKNVFISRSSEEEINKSLSKKDIYNNIWDMIIYSHTIYFYNIIRYIRTVIHGGPFSKAVSVKQELLPPFNFSKTVWNNIHKFTKIIQRNPNIPRNILGQYGDIILRSNAVEIIRFMEMIRISPTTTYEFRFRLYNESNSGSLKFRIEPTPKHSSVDLVIQYNSQK